MGEKRCRCINESYINIYLSIPVIQYGIGLWVTTLRYSTSFLVLYILYLYLVINVFITIRSNRKKNDKIILNGVPYKCELIGIETSKYLYAGSYGSRYKIKKDVFKLILKYQYGNKEKIYYSDILYIKGLHKVNCNTIYILNNELYPLLIREKNTVNNRECNSYIIDTNEWIKLLRTINFTAYLLLPIELGFVFIIKFLL